MWSSLKSCSYSNGEEPNCSRPCSQNLAFTLSHTALFGLIFSSTPVGLFLQLLRIRPNVPFHFRTIFKFWIISEIWSDSDDGWRSPAQGLPPSSHNQNSVCIPSYVLCAPSVFAWMVVVVDYEYNNNNNNNGNIWRCRSPPNISMSHSGIEWIHNTWQYVRICITQYARKKELKQQETGTPTYSSR
jgi:hypothetical protein